MKAHYKCKKCSFDWKATPSPTDCLSCGHIYVDWVNWEEWKKNAGDYSGVERN
jgi:hypothetical protein